MTFDGDPHADTSHAHLHLVHFQLSDNPQSRETQWHIRDSGGGTFHIINVKSNLYVNVFESGQHEGPCTWELVSIWITGTTWDE